MENRGFRVVRAYQVNHKKTLDRVTGTFTVDYDVFEAPTVDLYPSEEDYMRQFNAKQERLEKSKNLRNHKNAYYDYN